MSEHQHPQPSMERVCDVAVVGASVAGLAAALALVRQRRSVIVVDAGEPLTSPADRDEVRSHGGEVLHGRVVAVTRADGGHFRASLEAGHTILARQVLDVTGVVDAQPLAARVGADLDAEDAAAPDRPSATRTDWEHRYSGEQIWSGHPNGAVVEEVSGLAPGRALDVGAGEGGDAVWLAEQGWAVTAADISEGALRRVAGAVDARGLQVVCLQADANSPDPFGGETFDLVTASYASIPRTPDDRGITHLLGAVAPGGTLLVIGHDPEPMRAAAVAPGGGPAFDPDAYVQADDLAVTLANCDDWEVEVHELRPRPPGAASAHHVHDIVLRARRRSAF